MDAQTDAQLLRTYAERRSDAAFAALVRRHIDLVHSAARRMVCDTHLAEDVTQATFVALAQNAAQLTERPVLAGWLHRTAQNIAAQTVRTDVRRRAREQEAAAMNELLSDSGTDVPPAWSEIAPHLDAALGDLTEPERDAVLLRYFQRQSAREMAQTLGISDEAAQKRVSRAVERLREFFAKRGVTVGTSGLAVVISANAVQAAPVGLALTISTVAALTGTTLATTATATATKAIVMTTLQKTIVAATVAVLAGAGIYEARQAAQLREQNQMLQRQQAPLAEQMEQSAQQQVAMSNRLAALNDENERLKKNSVELLRLRGLVTRLRRQNDELEKAAPQKEIVGAEPYVSANEFAYVGLGSPEATAKTLVWAARNKDKETLEKALDLKNFEEATYQVIRNEHPGVSDADIFGGAKTNRQAALNLNFDDGRMIDLMGYQIMSQDFISSNDVVLTIANYFADGTSRTDKLPLHLVDGDWKLDVMDLMVGPLTITSAAPDGTGTNIMSTNVIHFKKELKPTYVPVLGGATNP